MKKVYKRHELLTLKAKIKGLAQEGARTHSILQKKKGLERDKYWRLKRKIGNDTRHHLIAYGFLRGRSFQEMEPNADLNLAFWNLHTRRILNIMSGHHSGHGWTFEDIEEQIFSSRKEKAA